MTHWTLLSVSQGIRSSEFPKPTQEKCCYSRPTYFLTMHRFEGPTLPTSCPRDSRFYWWILLTGPIPYSAGPIHLQDIATFVFRQGPFQARRQENISQIHLPEGLALGVFKDKGSGCQGVCRVEWNMLIAHRAKGGLSSFLSMCIWESCLFVGHMFRKWWHKHDEWERSRVCHHRGYFWSLLASSTRLQEFFPI